MKQVSSIIKLGLISSVVAMGVSGCIPAPAPKIQAEKSVGVLSFKYAFGQPKARINKK